MAEEIKKEDDIFAMLGDVSKLGYVEGDVKVGDLTITLSTLTAEEEADSFNNCIGYDGLAFINRQKLETLVYAVKAIKGVRFKYVGKTGAEYSAERAETIESLRHAILGWKFEVVSYVYSEYLKIAGQGEVMLKQAGISKNKDVEDALAKIAKDKQDIQSGTVPAKE